MASLLLTVRETLRYRGAVGQWSWVLHRVTGLGVLLFLFLHVIDTSWAAFYPELYEHAIQIYQSPLFTLGEFGLTFCVVYHAFNGLRIVIMDYRPDLWRYQGQAAVYVWLATGVTLLPLFVGMGLHALNHYQKPDINILPLDNIIVSQLPFIGGAAAAIIAALLLSGLYGMVTGNEKPAERSKHSGSAMERFWWSFMRISGVLILPLVIGHLLMIHVLQGVFDITAANYTAVGTNIVNTSGSAVEFVKARWDFAIWGVAIWRVYDIALLALVVTHGFNGLRYVITDYTMNSPFLRHAAVIVCTLVAVVLLAVGGAALIKGIEPSAIEQAMHAIRAIALAR